MSLRAISFGVALAALTGCGVIYTAPGVHDGVPNGSAYGTDFDVEVVSLTYESAAAANLRAYVPPRLPLAFQPGTSAAVVDSARQAARLPALPEGTARRSPRPGFLAEEFPPLTEPEAYRMGISDVLLLSVNGRAALENLPGLISAQSKRQGYIVQDDGAIAIPDAGRVRVAGMTLQDAEAEIFRALAAAGIDPSFSLEIAEFNSQRVSIGGLVSQPQLIPVSLTPLYLHEAIAVAGGIAATDPDTTLIQLFRSGKTYRIGLARFLSEPAARRIVLRNGDSIHVGSAYREAEAQRYFDEQLRLLQFQNSRLQDDAAGIQAQREATAVQRLAAERDLFKERLELGAVERHYAYRAGEVRQPGRVALPFERSMSLADVLFDEGGININFGDYAEIYVLRANVDPQHNGGLTAFHLDAENAVNLAVATRFELRPNDVVFVAEQTVTSWNRTISQILPQLFTTVLNSLGSGGAI